jgi:hypothetical protein
MHFRAKNTVKNNRYHTLKYYLNNLPHHMSHLFLIIFLIFIPIFF